MDAAVQQSVLSWAITSLGPVFAPLILGSGVLIFLGACVVVLFQRRPSVIAAYLVFVPLPWLMGILGTCWGGLQTLSAIAMSEVAPKPSELAAGISTSLFSSLVGLVASLPAYLVVAMGLLIRTLWQRDDPKPL